MTTSAGVILLYSKSRHQRNDVELLVVKQRGGKWGLPKGHLKCDESVVDCAYRELREETGVTRRQLQRCSGRLLAPLCLNNIYFVVIALQKRPVVAEFGYDCDEIECSQWCCHEWLLRSFNRRRYNRTLSEDSLLAIQRLYVKTYKNNPPSNRKRHPFYNGPRARSAPPPPPPPPPPNAWFHSAKRRTVCNDTSSPCTTNDDTIRSQRAYNEVWGRILYPPTATATLEPWHSDWRQQWHEQCTWQQRT